MSGAGVFGVLALGLAFGLWVYFRDRCGAIEAKIEACRTICDRLWSDEGMFAKLDRIREERRPLPVEDERVFVVKPIEICTAVPAGWESWCPGHPGTECTVRFSEDGYTWFTVAFA